MRRATIALTTLLTVMCLTACDDSITYNKYRHADTEGWEKNKALEFGIDSLKESGTYALTLKLRISDNYPFRNLHIVVDQTVFPSGQTINDTITCHVTDRRGNMLGHGVALYQFDLPLRKHFYLHGDSIHVRVRHNMKREILPGTNDVGIQLRKDAE